MPKNGQGQGRGPRSLMLPVRLQTALEALVWRTTKKTYDLVGEGRYSCSALLHHRLPKHFNLQTRLRFHFRISTARTKTVPPRWENGRAQACSATLMSMENAICAPKHAVDSTASNLNPATCWTTTSAAWPPMRLNAFAARSWSAPATGTNRKDHRSGSSPRSNEYGWEVWPSRGAIRCVVLGFHAHGRMGRNTVTHVLGRRAFVHSCFASR